MPRLAETLNVISSAMIGRSMADDFHGNGSDIARIIDRRDHDYEFIAAHLATVSDIRMHF